MRHDWTDRKICWIVLVILMATPVEGELAVTAADIDSLVLSFELEEVAEYFETKLPHDRMLRQQRTLAVARAFYGFRAGLREIGLLQKERDNLAALYRLARAKSERGEIGDAEVLRAHNALIGAKLTVLRKIEACRGYLLDIVKLVGGEVIVDSEQKTKVAGNLK